ncbi:MAG: oxidative damage protection protein [Pseudomonadota bacterium]
MTDTQNSAAEPRTVLCRKYREVLPGLAKPPMPGKAGEDIYADVSLRAWEEWTALQTRLINEMQLNLLDRDTRKYLAEQMRRFLANEATDEAEGFEPEAEG